VKLLKPQSPVPQMLSKADRRNPNNGVNVTQLARSSDHSKLIRKVEVLED